MAENQTPIVSSVSNNLSTPVPQVVPVRPDVSPVPAPLATSDKAGNAFQWFREVVTAIISLTILWLASHMLSSTYEFAKKTAVPLDATTAAAVKEQYDRQKDLMLYAIALLGTVTGYYLGRVPAELHAQQAQRQANSAQNQLNSTQTQLTKTATQAAVAGSQVSAAVEAKIQAQSKTTDATNALEQVQTALKSLNQPSGVITEGMAVGASTPSHEVNSRSLKKLQEDVDLALIRLRSH